MNNKGDNKMKYCSYLTLFSACLFTGCASMNGYCPNPNDASAQGVLRFTGAVINAANQSITGYSVPASGQDAVETKKSVASTAMVAPSASDENDLETIIVPAEYTPSFVYDPNLVIVIQP